VEMLRKDELCLHLNANCGGVKEGVDKFNELYCKVFEDVNKTWVASPLSNNFMNFNTVMQEYFKNKRGWISESINLS